MPPPFETLEVIRSYNLQDLFEEEFGQPYNIPHMFTEGYQNTFHEIDMEQGLFDDKCDGMNGRNDTYSCPSFSEWIYTPYYPSRYNRDCPYQPRIEVMCQKLRQRGYYIPDEFYIVVIW